MICPFCSLLCDADDLSTIECNRRSSSLVQLALRPQEPSCDLESMLADAKQVLQRAKRVLVTGRIASVETARAAVAFADKYNAILDCAESGHLFKNVLALQRSGLNSVSIAEARDRTDLFIIVGDDGMLQSVPRMPFALRNDSPDQRTVLLLGDFGPESICCWKKAGFDTWTVQCELKKVPMALSQWSRWSDRVLSEGPIANPLLDRMARAHYTTILWCAENLPIAQADLWIERVLQWITARNEKLRCAALPWTSSDGTFQQVSTWLTGFPGRIAFRAGLPEYDPLRNSYEHWIEQTPSSLPGESVLVLIDETTASKPFLPPSERQGLCRSHTIELTVDAGNAETGTLRFPTMVAGYERSADMFRADQTLLAHVLPTTDQAAYGKSASYWLEELSS